MGFAALRIARKPSGPPHQLRIIYSRILVANTCRFLGALLSDTWAIAPFLPPAADWDAAMETPPGGRYVCGGWEKGETHHRVAEDVRRNRHLYSEGDRITRRPPPSTTWEDTRSERISAGIPHRRCIRARISGRNYRGSRFRAVSGFRAFRSNGTCAAIRNRKEIIRDADFWRRKSLLSRTDLLLRKTSRSALPVRTYARLRDVYRRLDGCAFYGASIAETHR